MKKIFCTILLIIFFSFNFLGQTKSEHKEVVTIEDYEVWAKIWCNAESKSLKVIEDQTISPKIVLKNEEEIGLAALAGYISEDYLKKKLPDVTKELIEDFNLKNEKSYKLEKKFIGCANYVLISKKELETIFEKSSKRNVWENFRPIHKISRIGLTSNKKKALIYFEYYCGPLCASGDYYFFVKEDGGKWIKKGQINLWVS